MVGRLLLLALLLCGLCVADGDIGTVDKDPPAFSEERAGPPPRTGRFASLTQTIQRQTRQAECDSKWTDIDPNHTMCRKDRGTEVVLDQATKDALLQQHNDLRGRVSPIAGNMPKLVSNDIQAAQLLVWDDELALVAAKWARRCVVKHDNGNARRVPSLPGIHVGQNAAFGYRSFTSAVQAWFNEYKNFKYGTGSKGGVVGHYTQMAAARTHRIGCGQADCPGYKYRRYYICNYAVGQYTSDLVKPYKKATKSCARCPGKCDSTGKLCDCGGKLCLNGGSLDIATCSCTCPDIYSGPTCEKNACKRGLHPPATEPSTNTPTTQSPTNKLGLCVFK
ncbi:hypothetical protein BaRGS_00002518 [Batillaria attramentaria]|uniref:SCP domain-containing protein n=1 Tax=Batillaria attramentaria TaxID=370345 RepID=A0ABD0M4F6_9CAEN